MGSGQRDKVIMDNCTLDEGAIEYFSPIWATTLLSNQVADHAEIDLFLSGISPRAFKNSKLTGYGLRIKSKSTGASSTVSFNPASSAFSLIIGDSNQAVEYINKYNRNQIYGYQYRSGGQGLSGYAIGSLDIGMYRVGANSDNYVGALGKRLGDCSSANKTLTIVIDGVTYNIVFNKNYNGTAITVLPNYTNTQIIAEITAVIGSVADVDEYTVGRDYYPQFDNVKNMVNADTAEVLSGMGVFFTGLKTFRKATNADGKIDGICLDDGRVGDECRIITAGEIYSMVQSDTGYYQYPCRFVTKESTSGHRNIGDKLGISTTVPGVFVLNQTPYVLRAKRTDVLTFI